MENIKELIQSFPNSYLGKGASKEAIKSAAKSLNVEFSKEYHDYLSTFGIAAVNGHEFTGISTSPRLNVVDVTIYERKYTPTASMDWYVIEQADIDGIVVWQSSSGEVYQTLPNAEPIKLCNSLSEYISF